MLGVSGLFPESNGIRKKKRGKARHRPLQTFVAYATKVCKASCLPGFYEFGFPRGKRKWGPLADSDLPIMEKVDPDISGASAPTWVAQATSLCRPATRRTEWV